MAKGFGVQWFGSVVHGMERHAFCPIKKRSVQKGFFMRVPGGKSSAGYFS